MLDCEPLPVMHFLLVTLRGKGKICEVLRRVFTGCGIFLTCSQMMWIFHGHNDVFIVYVACVYLYIALSMVCLNFIMDIDNLIDMQRKFCFSVHSTSALVKRRMFNLCRIQDTMALIMFLALLLLWEPFFLDIEKLRKYDFTSVLLRQHQPTLEPLYIIVLICWFIAVSPMVISWGLIYVYFGWHLQIQIMMLIQNIEDIAISIDDRPVGLSGNLVDDAVRQQIIRKRLKFIVNRHAELFRYHRESMESVHVNITSLLLGLSSLFGTLTICWILVTERRLGAPGVLIPIFLIGSEIICGSAQQYEDRFDAVYDAALKVSWYDWNQQNKMAYLLIVQKSSQLVPYIFFNSPVNRRFQLEMLKVLYSGASILINFYS